MCLDLNDENMESGRTEPVAGRVPLEQAELLEQSVDEQDCTKAELVQRAVEYYIDRNPDEIPAFFPEDSLAAFAEELC